LAWLISSGKDKNLTRISRIFEGREWLLIAFAPLAYSDFHLLRGRICP
jgi:hypothetical protein